jgi:hypothetical protein
MQMQGQFEQHVIIGWIEDFFAEQSVYFMQKVTLRIPISAVPYELKFKRLAPLG